MSVCRPPTQKSEVYKNAFNYIKKILPYFWNTCHAFHSYVKSKQVHGKETPTPGATQQMKVIEGSEISINSLFFKYMFFLQLIMTSLDWDIWTFEQSILQI